MLAKQCLKGMGTVPAPVDRNGVIKYKSCITMPLSTASIFGRRAMNRITAADYIVWATDMLTTGHDSPNLRMLAGLDEYGSVFEAEDHFARALREFQIPEPDLASKLRAYGLDLAQQILEGKLSAESGVKALFHVCLATNYERDYVIWLHLDDAWDSIQAGCYPFTYPTATIENFADVVRTEAQKFITQMTQKH